MKPDRYISKNEWPAFIIYLSESDRADVLSFLLVPELMLFTQALSPLSFGYALPAFPFRSCAPGILEHEDDDEKQEDDWCKVKGGASAGGQADKGLRKGYHQCPILAEPKCCGLFLYLHPPEEDLYGLHPIPQIPLSGGISGALGIRD